MFDDLAIRLHMIEAAKRLYQKNMLAAADGNISYKFSDDYILMTPSGLSKAFISPEDIAVIRLDGTVVNGKPSSEKLMHLGVYRNCSQARCVVHAHPPTAIAWTIAKPNLDELPCECLSELILGVGKIPIAPYARPGTDEMAEVILPLLSEHPVIILARHGALAWAKTLEEATNGIERLEHTAEILFKAELLGGLTYLPDEEVDYLKSQRQQLCAQGGIRIL
jgi:L-fuculose-phosphate aldolase